MAKKSTNTNILQTKNFIKMTKIIRIIKSKKKANYFLEEYIINSTLVKDFLNKKNNY